MKIRVLAVAAVMSACGQQVSTYSASSGSLALSRDDAFLYAVDSDSDSLFVLNSRDESVVAKVAVGHQPEKVIVGSDDTVYVSNRMSRSVSVIKRGDWKEASHLATAVEPTGMAFTGDGKTLLVVNATSLTDSAFGTVMAFDTSSLQMQYEIPVGAEPRAIAVNGNKAFVSLYKDGDVATIDLGQRKMLSASTETANKLNQTALGNPEDQGQGQFNAGGAPDDKGGFFQTGIATVHPLGVESLTVTPDGKQMFAASVLSSDQVLPSTPNDSVAGPEGIISSGGDGYSGSTGCGNGSVVSPAIITFDGEGATKAHDLGGCFGQHIDGQPSQLLVSSTPSMPIQGPAAAVVDPTGAFLFVVGRSSNNVAILPTSSALTTTNNNTAVDAPTPNGGFINSNGGDPSAATTISVGAAPTGIALSHDGKTAWVLNAFDHSISRLERKDDQVQVVHETQFTTDVLDKDVVAGRKLFFSAVDSRMTSQTTGIACASCHLEGREDGHVWNFTDGPRQTPSLAGRMTKQTLPLHWNGEFDGMTSFMAQTVNHRMGGFGVTPAMEEQISAFIESQPTPDNPFKQAQPTAAQARGALVFAAAGCATCHLGQAMTDNGFHDVGTFDHARIDNNGNVVPGSVDVLPRLSFGPDGQPGLNTPSLLGLARTAPYLHDGSALTLKARVLNDEGGKHGVTKSLPPDQLDDLVDYLHTL